MELFKLISATIERSNATLLKDTTDICGTPLALAPEVMDGHPQKRSTDVWSMGITAYEMVSLEHPFSNPRMQKAVNSALKADKKSRQPRTPEEEAEHEAFGVMRSSCVMAREGDGKKLNVVKVLDDVADKGGGQVKKKKGGLAGIRKPDDFKKVASRFSTNERFVQRFQELAVAVTSEGLEVGMTHERFAECVELKKAVELMLTRNRSKRPTAEQLKAILPVPPEPGKGKDKAAWA